MIFLDMFIKEESIELIKKSIIKRTSSVYMYGFQT